MGTSMNSNSEEMVPLTPEQTALVTQFTYIAAKIAKRRHNTAPHALELDDLRSNANYGLVQAAKRWKGYCADKTVERQAKQDSHFELTGKHFYPPDQVRYDPARLDFFAVYAAKRCDGAIMDELRSRDYATRSLRAKFKRLREAGLDEGVSISDLAVITGMKVGEVSQIINDMQNRPVSLDAEGNDFEVPQSTESQTTVHTILLATAEAVRALPVEQQIVLAMHYFKTRETPDGRWVRTLQLQQVAVELGVPEGYVSELHTEGVLAVHASMLEVAKGVAYGDDDD